MRASSGFETKKKELYKSSDKLSRYCTLPGHKNLYRPKFALIFLRIYLVIRESTH